MFGIDVHLPVPLRVRLPPVLDLRALTLDVAEPLGARARARAVSLAPHPPRAPAAARRRWATGSWATICSTRRRWRCGTGHQPPVKPIRAARFPHRDPGFSGFDSRNIRCARGEDPKCQGSSAVKFTQTISVWKFVRSICPCPDERHFDTCAAGYLPPPSPADNPPPPRWPAYQHDALPLSIPCTTLGPPSTSLKHPRDAPRSTLQHPNVRKSTGRARVRRTASASTTTSRTPRATRQAMPHRLSRQTCETRSDVLIVCVR